MARTFRREVLSGDRTTVYYPSKRARLEQRRSDRHSARRQLREFAR